MNKYFITGCTPKSEKRKYASFNLNISDLYWGQPMALKNVRMVEFILKYKILKFSVLYFWRISKLFNI